MEALTAAICGVLDLVGKQTDQIDTLQGAMSSMASIIRLQNEKIELLQERLENIEKELS